MLTRDSHGGAEATNFERNMVSLAEWITNPIDSLYSSFDMQNNPVLHRNTVIKCRINGRRDAL
jgi:hypothetical protein